MAFEMIGVELDQAGDDVVAAHILVGPPGACVDAGDKTVAQYERALDDLVGKHDAGIGQNGLGSHLRQSLGFRRSGQAVFLAARRPSA